MAQVPALDTLVSSDADDRLTTGEAAELLGCSRQHVVDLCEGGRLPFSSVGRHRRVRRSDVESLRAGTDEMNRAERRSLWLAHAVAGRIVVDPDRAIASAREQLELMRPMVRGRARQWLEEWDRLLDGPVLRLVDQLVDRSPLGKELRQNSPFAGVLDEHERADALEAWRRQDRRSVS